MPLIAVPLAFIYVTILVTICAIPIAFIISPVTCTEERERERVELTQALLA